jgi:nucleoside 2-deoxyribosyltransferase
MKPIRVYLAGPEVFLKEARAVGEAKKVLCKKYGFIGVFPLVNEVDAKDKSPREVGLCISAVNEELIRTCDVVVANLTPFRGPSADVGTVFELGFAYGLGKKVYAYTNIATPFTQRTKDALKGEVNRCGDGKLRDAQGMFIEEVDCVDNLMLDCCLHASGAPLIVEQAQAGQLYTFLGAFEKCLRAVQADMEPKKQA